MFEYFKKITADGRYEGFKYLDYHDFSKEELSSMAGFLAKMQYISYDVRNEVISMSTKEGEVYSLEDMLAFNEEYEDYFKIIGAGNEDTSVTIDGGCAIIEFKVNEECFREEILDIKKSVKLIDLIDTFDVYPLDIIKDRAIEVAAKYGVSRICLVGDYAMGVAAKNSTIDFIVDFNGLTGFFDRISFESRLIDKFKVDVNVFDMDEMKFDKHEAIIIN